MKLSMEINDEQLSRLVNEELGNLDRETVRDIAVSGLREFFSNQDNVRNIILKYGGRLGSQWELSPSFEQMVTSAIRPEDLREFTEKIMSVAMNDTRRLLEGAIARTFVANLFTEENKARFAWELEERFAPERR